MATEKHDFHLELKRRRKALKLSTDALAAEADLGIDLGDGRKRDGGTWLRGLEAGKPASVDRATCHRLEIALGLPRDHLWDLLLLDPRQLNPEIRAYYDERIQRLEREAVRGDVTNMERELLIELREWAGYEHGAASWAYAHVLEGLRRVRNAAHAERLPDADAPNKAWARLLDRLCRMPPAVMARLVMSFEELAATLDFAAGIRDTLRAEQKRSPE